MRNYMRFLGEITIWEGITVRLKLIYLADKCIVFFDGKFNWLYAFLISILLA